MTKSETGLSFQQDSYSIALLVVVGFLGFLELFGSVLIPEFVIRLLLAISSIIASIFYFLRVKNLTTTTSTPISDTFVVLGGLYTAIVLMVTNLTDLAPSLLLSVILIVLGVVGRLFLLDSILQSAIEGLGSVYSKYKSWLKQSPLHIVQSLLIFIGLIFLLIVPSVNPNFTLSMFLGVLLFSVVFWIDILRSIQYHSAIRIVGGVVSTIALPFLLIIPVSGISRIGLFLLDLSLLMWSVTLPTLKIWIRRIKAVIPGILRWLKNLLTVIFKFLSKHKIVIGRALLLITGAVLIILSQGDVLRLGLGIASLLLSLIDKIYAWALALATWIYGRFLEEPVQTLQFIFNAMGPVAYIALPKDNNLNVIVALLLIFVGLAPSILPPLYRILKKLLSTISMLFREHPVGSFQVTSFLLAIPSYLLIPASLFVGSIQIKIIVVVTLVGLGLLPTTIDVISWLLPVVKDFAYSVAVWINERLKSPNTYYFLSTTIGIILLVVLPADMMIPRIGAAILTGVGISLLGNGYLMIIYDNLVFGLMTVFDLLYRLIRSIIPRLSFGVFQSMLSWILLIVGVTGLFVPELQYRGWLRFGLVILAIVMWNTAYPNRRERFVKFINTITAGIARRLYGFFSWLFRNIFILLLSGLGFVFLIISLGMIFPGMISFVRTIFGTILDNRLISWILGLFFFGMGIFTWYQISTRRVDLQLSSGGTQK